MRRAIDAGLAYVTEDRKQLGLLLAEDVRKNVTLANLAAVSSAQVIDDVAELAVASDYRGRMRIRSHSVYQEAGKLSGGNQAEGGAVEMAVHRPEGADPRRAHARHRCRREVRDLPHHQRAGRRRQQALWVISSEMPELLGICDRICVMNEGAFVGEFSAAEATQEKIMRTIMRKADRPRETRP